MKNKSFAKRFLKAYLACTVVILNFASIMGFYILLHYKSWWCIAALCFIPVTIGLLVPMISDWFAGCDD